MRFCRSAFAVAVLLQVPMAGAAQEIALKGGVAVSRFQTTGTVPYDGSFVSTSYGGHARFRFGPVALQPELHIISRGGSIEGTATDERLKLEYIEIPIALVVPVRIGRFEPYAFAGPVLSLETRCRSIIEQDGLKTNFGCDDPSAGNAFDRSVLDYGVSGGAGVSYPLGSGRILLEGRYTWGLRNIYEGPDSAVEVRNRSYVFSIGYAILMSTFDD
ncbi:MAG TPA: porin family protein [Longimicrobiales bacterium]